MNRESGSQGRAAVTLSGIDTLGREGLLALWLDLVGGPAPKAISQPMLQRILAFELQARLHGGLSKAVLRQVTPSVEGTATPKRTKAERLKPGGRFIREWAGTSHVVDVIPEGYRWKNRTYRSLSAIAREITGAHWSGPRFFGLATSGDARTSKPKMKGVRQ
jgi:hypothetical protein